MRTIIKQIEDFLQEKIKSKHATGGGCIAQSEVITTESGKNFFLKTGVNKPNIFSNEKNGILELAKAGCIRVPKVILHDDDFLLIENINQGSKSKNFFVDFGTQLAKLHKYNSHGYGFYEDNYIGLTPQINRTTKEEYSNWVVFYFNKRLKYQYELAQRNGYTSDKLRKGFSLLENKIDEILAGCEMVSPSLLHGDLWNGNYLCDENGKPVLIDPAVYYGHREAELAMTKLFGGFSPEFYEAYNTAYPLQDGYDYRENIYLLYHVMNHLNIFGSSYYSQTLRLIWSYL